MKALRVIQQVIAILVAVVGLVAILDLPLYFFRVSLFPQQYLAAFWGLVSCLIFLQKPWRPGAAGPRWFDLLLAATALCLGLYVALFYGEIMLTVGLVNPFRTLLGLLAVVVVLESTRRLAGWPLLMIIGFFILYGRYGAFFPGPLKTTGIAWPRLLNQLFLGTDFLFGSPLRIVVLVVFVFILFGQLLFETGGGDMFIRLAQSLMGRYRGGPAKAAVVASSLFGTISGSAVGNVVSTGMITIPLMKRTGYSPTFAGAVEAVASTGGALLPPVMGAAAFVMTEFLGVPYSAVVMVALVPALAYYLGLFLQVDLRAARRGLRGLQAQEIPRLGAVLREGWIYVLPLVVLIYTLFFMNLEVTVAALYSCVVTVLLSLLKRVSRQAWSFSRIVELCEEMARSMLEITAISAAAGFVVGLVAYTGLGSSLSQTLTALAGDSLLLLALMTALTSTVMGMGMPATATYILLAVLMAPAMVAMGVQPLLAHLFVFYFGNFSFLTPPVALAAYAGASIAGAPPMATGWQAMRLALTGYIVPFIFLYKPGLALAGTAVENVLAVVDTVVAVAFLAVAVEGYWRSPLRWWERAVLGVASLAMFVPGWTSRIVGLAVAAPILLLHLRAVRQGNGDRRTAEVAASTERR